MPEEPSWSPGPAPGPRSRCSHGTPSCGWQWLRGSPRSTALRGRGIRTSVRAASDDARWVIVAEHLEELRSAVRFERPASLLSQTHGVGRPHCFAYFDHHPCNLVIATDLPQPAAAATLGARVPTEVCPDLPTVELRIVHHTSGSSAARPTISMQAMPRIVVDTAPAPVLAGLGRLDDDGIGNLA